MDEWKKIHFSNISQIEKCVGEFNIWELNICPYAKFKIKIFENSDGNFTGYSNLLVIDEIGEYYCAVGYGNTLEIALEDTIQYFFKMTSRKPPEEWTEKDFICSNSFDF